MWIFLWLFGAFSLAAYAMGLFVTLMDVWDNDDDDDEAGTKNELLKTVLSFVLLAAAAGSVTCLIYGIREIFT